MHRIYFSALEACLPYGFGVKEKENVPIFTTNLQKTELQDVKMKFRHVLEQNNNQNHMEKLTEKISLA